MPKINTYPLSDLAFKLRFNIGMDICVEQSDKKGKLWSIGIWNHKKRHYEYSDDLSLVELQDFVINAATEALVMAVGENKLAPKGKK
jgi:hypothetical protein